MEWAKEAVKIDSLVKTNEDTVPGEHEDVSPDLDVVDDGQPVRDKAVHDACCWVEWGAGVSGEIILLVV